MRKYRAQKRGFESAVTVAAPRASTGRRGLQPQATVTALNVVEDSSPGPAEQGVLNVTAGLSTAAAREDLVQAALAMARILDDPRQVTTQPSAAAKLESLMAALHRGAERRKGWLAEVQSMSRGAG